MNESGEKKMVVEKTKERSSEQVVLSIDREDDTRSELLFEKRRRNKVAKSEHDLALSRQISFYSPEK